MEIDYKAIGKRLKEARKNAGWTQQQLAKESKMSVGYVSKIERGSHHSVGGNMLANLARTLNLSLDFVVFGKKPGFSENIYHYFRDCSEDELRFCRESLLLYRKYRNHEKMKLHYEEDKTKKLKII